MQALEKEYQLKLVRKQKFIKVSWIFVESFYILRLIKPILCQWRDLCWSSLSEQSRLALEELNVGTKIKHVTWTVYWNTQTSHRAAAMFKMFVWLGYLSLIHVLVPSWALFSYLTAMNLICVTNVILLGLKFIKPFKSSRMILGGHVHIIRVDDAGNVWWKPTHPAS